MAVRSAKQGHGSTAAVAAVLAFAGLLAAPVLAAPERDYLCDESAAPDLDVSARELIATPVNNSEELLKDHLLKPRAEAAVRTAFADEETDAQVEEEPTEEAVDLVTTEPVLPGASDPKALRLKRQMYRRDI